MNALALVAAVFSALAALASAAVAWIAYQGQRSLAQRGNIVPVWNHLSSLSDVDPEKPNATHVVNAINTLEFVALCVEYGVLDRKIVMRTFRDGYIRHYEQVRRCEKIPHKAESGLVLLEQNLAATTLYHQLKHEALQRDKA